MPLRIIESEAAPANAQPKHQQRRRERPSSSLFQHEQERTVPSVGNSCCYHCCTVCANSPLRGRSCHGAGAVHQSEDRFFAGAAVATDGEAHQHHLTSQPHALRLDLNLVGQPDVFDDFDPLDVSVLDLMRFGDHPSAPLVPFKPQTMQEREDRNRDMPRIDHRRACQLADAAQSQLDKLNMEWSRMMETNGTANALSSSSCSLSRVVAPLDKSEVVIGARLGSGGFSAVYEVHSLRLDATVDDSLDNSQRAARTFLQQRADPVSSSSSASSSTSSSRPSRRNSDDSLLGMLDFGLQRTTARYAVKHLRYSLAENVSKFEKAAVDLTLEARLLSVLDHPNIVSVRGWSRHGAASFRGGGSSDYFLVIDCLPEQLDDRFFSWRQQFRKYQSKLESTRRGAALSKLLRLPFGGRPKRQSKLQAKLHDLLLERLQVAHDVASGIEYLHDRRVMHRDIKACNIGFDADGVAQIFDLGLARLLPPEEEELDDGYVMSRVGTKSCMAPEVADKRPYGLKADVYSFGIVLWEVLSLCSASEYFRMLKRKESAKKNGSALFGASVSPLAAAAATASDASTSPLSREGSSSSVYTNKDECVLPICKCWSESIQELVARCLSSRPEHRPTMSEARQVLYHELEKGGYEFSSPSHPRRRRSTFRLDADANAKGHHRTNSKDATTVASAAKIVASMMRNKLDDNDEDSSTAFNSCTCTASS